MPWIVVGAYDTQYNARTVYEIDANLESLRRDHPDVDRLLDARRLVAAANALFPARCTLNPARECPPELFEPCACARRLAEEHGVR